MKEVEKQIDKLLNEKLFATIRKMIVSSQKDKYVKSLEYTNAKSSDKKKLLDDNFSDWFNSISSFFLSYKSIIALHPLVLREIKIREFLSEEIIKIKSDYIFKGIEFSAILPTQYDSTMSKEIEDCISDLTNKNYSHIVDNFILKTDTEKAPHEPLTTAELKFSAFYLFNYKPEQVTSLAKKLFDAELITNPETNGWLIQDDVVENIITILNQKYPEEKVLQYKRIFNDKIVERYNKECIRPTKIFNEYFPKNIRKTIEFGSIVIEREYEEIELVKLYEFIFYITLSTQLKNSIYDTSTMDIVVGNRTLKAQSNILIDGEENWELLTGKILKKISNNSDSNYKQVSIIPEINSDTVLQPLNVYDYSSWYIYVNYNT